MKIAIFHNSLDSIGGAEIVVLTLARELGADVFTTNITAEKIEKMGFIDVLPRIYSIGRVSKIAPFRQQLIFWKFRRLNLSGRYDFFIIAGDWAMSGAVNNRPNLWYAHSPLNELWEFKGYIERELLNFWKKPLYAFWVWFNRKLSLKYAQSVDNWVANSNNTKKRIKKYYDREAQIIYPPVSTKKYLINKSIDRQSVNNQFEHNQSKNRKDYWLSVNRLVAHKRPEIQIKAFNKLPRDRLIMVASYEKGVAQFETCKALVNSLKSPNIEIKHWVSDEELRDLYLGCRGFITTALNEDFGMTVVEAMAAGKPVIAAKEGGYLETIIDGETGILIEDIDSAKLKVAIENINNNLKNNPSFYEKACLKRAQDFDTVIFTKKIKNIINTI